MSVYRLGEVENPSMLLSGGDTTATEQPIKIRLDNVVVALGNGYRRARSLRRPTITAIPSWRSPKSRIPGLFSSDQEDDDYELSDLVDATDPGDKGNDDETDIDNDEVRDRFSALSASLTTSNVSTASSSMLKFTIARESDLLLTLSTTMHTTAVLELPIDGVLPRKTSGFRWRTGSWVFPIFVNSLYRDNYIDRDRFTIALGNYENQKSYLIVGDNAGSTLLSLKSLTIGEKTHKIMKDTVIDSGTTLFYLTVDAFKWLDETLGGRYSLHGHNMVYPTEQGDEMIKFNFETFSVTRRLSDMLDPRPNARVKIEGQSFAYGAFKPMGSLQLGSSLATCCLLGNFFMRGLVVEFERINYGTGGRVRFSSLSVNNV
ncbi:hypothetical protein B0H14DRAFT_3707062 [Mycena olivaceomarginata]|nr:hypothetical protein B0H14DRAFT_3707062 [Mycena olivaceomarginata]